MCRWHYIISINLHKLLKHKLQDFKDLNVYFEDRRRGSASWINRYKCVLRLGIFTLCMLPSSGCFALLHQQTQSFCIRVGGSWWRPPRTKQPAWVKCCSLWNLSDNWKWVIIEREPRHLYVVIVDVYMWYVPAASCVFCHQTFSVQYFPTTESQKNLSPEARDILSFRSAYPLYLQKQTNKKLKTIPTCTHDELSNTVKSVSAHRVSPKNPPMNQLWDRYLHVCHWWLILLAEGAADRLGVQECEEAGECVRPHVPHGHDVSDHHWPHSGQGQVGPIHLKISFYTII